MRKSAVFSLKSALKEGFLILRQSELQALDALPGWMTRLYLSLLRCTDYGSGKGETSYANLQALMTPIQPRSGPRHYVPDLQALKKAVRLLEDRRLLSRDKLHSQDQGRLLFVVMPRYDETPKKRKLEPPTRTPAAEREANNHAGSGASTPETRAPDSNPSSTASFLHIKEEDLSTNGVPKPPEAPNPPGPISFAAGDQKLGPPRGAEHSPHEAGTPPRPSRYAQAVRASLRGEKIGPPGGQDDAPLAAPAQQPPSARIRRPGNTVLRGEALQSGGEEPRH